MKRHLRMWLVTVLFLPLYGLAQNKNSTINSVLHGRITDSKRGLPVEGASVNIKNTTHSGFTYRDGKFHFRTGQKLPYVLLISNVGYKSLNITANSEDIEIRLEEQAAELDEVVVTGVA